MSLYTVSEIETIIREIDDEIRALGPRPNQQSFEGNFVAWQGKMSELRASRRDWMMELKRSRAAENNANPLQGPRTSR
jgi:hypothetical protein